MTKSRTSNFSDSEVSEYCNLPVVKLSIPDQQYMLDVMKKFGIEVPRDGEPSRDFIRTDNKSDSVDFSDQSSYEILLAEPNLSNTVPIPLDKAKSVASETLKNFDLDRDASLVFDGFLQASGYSQAIESASGEEIRGPQITQTTVLFRQIINGLRVITPGIGELNISVDNDGTVIKISSSIRQVKKIIFRPGKTMIEPPNYYQEELPEIPARKSHEKSLDEKTRKLLTSWIFSGQLPVQFNIIPGSTEIGYDIRNDEAVPIVRRAVDVDFGEGYHKRYWVTVDLF